MPKYLYVGSYTADAVKGVLKEGGSSRRDAVRRLIESGGGKLEAFYFAFGDNDFYIVADFPDSVCSFVHLARERLGHGSRDDRRPPHTRGGRRSHAEVG